MAQTVIGIFKNSTEAENAKEHLLQEGFTGEMVDISTQTGTTIAGRSTMGEEDLGDKISRFFHNLFGNENEGAKYAKAASRGTVVTVHAQTTEQAESAATILDDYGAVDVDEYASDQGTAGTDQTRISGSADVDRLGGMNSGRVGIVNTKPLDTGASGTEQKPETSAGAENPETPQKEAETGGQRNRSRIVDQSVDESSRLRPEQMNVQQNTGDEETEDFDDGFIEVVEYSETIIIEEPEDEEGFREVDRTQETVRETLSKAEDTGKQRPPDATEENKTREEHHVKDDPHHQRPGII